MISVEDTDPLIRSSRLPRCLDLFDNTNFLFLKTVDHHAANLYGAPSLQPLRPTACFSRCLHLTCFVRLSNIQFTPTQAQDSLRDVSGLTLSREDFHFYKVCTSWHTEQQVPAHPSRTKKLLNRSPSDKKMSLEQEITERLFVKK